MTSVYRIFPMPIAYRDRGRVTGPEDLDLHGAVFEAHLGIRNS